MHRRVRPFPLFALLFATLALPATAQTPIQSRGPISAPGSYVLTRNLIEPCNGTPLLEIQADGVTLDLRGFILDCTDDSAPLIQAVPRGNLVIRDGLLEGGAGQSAPLIRLEPPTGGSHPQIHHWTYRLEKLRLREFETAIKADGGSRAYLEVQDVEMSSGRGKDGLLVEGFAGVTVADTVVRLGRLRGTYGSPTPNFGDIGIGMENVEMVEIRQCAIYQALQGISLSGVVGGRLSGNLLSFTYEGIYLYESRAVAVVNNTVSCTEPCFSGIWVAEGSTENTLDGNSILGAPWGLLFSHGGNQYSNNRIITRTISSHPIFDGSGGNTDGGRNVS